MPYDYAASENRFVAHHFLEEITADIWLYTKEEEAFVNYLAVS